MPDRPSSAEPTSSSTERPPSVVETDSLSKARAIQQFLAEKGVSFRTEIVRNRISKTIRYVITELR
jgi:hypothetical protein